MLTGSVHGESASTALVVAAYYRFRKLAPWLSTAEMNEACDRAFDGVMAKVTDEGWMTQVSLHISSFLLILTLRLSIHWVLKDSWYTPTTTRYDRQKDKRSSA
jgi:hypothetical protein